MKIEKPIKEYFQNLNRAVRIPHPGLDRLPELNTRKKSGFAPVLVYSFVVVALLFTAFAMLPHRSATLELLFTKVAEEQKVSKTLENFLGKLNEAVCIHYGKGEEK